MLTYSSITDIQKNPIGDVLDHLDVFGAINICVSLRCSGTLCIFCVSTHNIVTIIPQFASY